MLHFQQQHGGAGQQQLYKPPWCSICSPSPCNVQGSLMRATGRQLQSQPNNTEGGLGVGGGGSVFCLSSVISSGLFLPSPPRSGSCFQNRSDLRGRVRPPAHRPRPARGNADRGSLTQQWQTPILIKCYHESDQRPGSGSGISVPSKPKLNKRSHFSLHFGCLLCCLEPSAMRRSGVVC